MRPQTLAQMLAGGDRRSIGRSNETAELVLRRPERFAELVECMWDEDAVVRMRAADAAEKVSGVKPELLKPYKRELLGLLAEAEQIEMRWHLAAMVPRLVLTGAERLRAVTRGCVTGALPGGSQFDCEDVCAAGAYGPGTKRAEAAGARETNPGRMFGIGDGGDESARAQIDEGVVRVVRVA
jgi:hypothetical protein